MPIELKITAADTHEFDALLARFVGPTVRAPETVVSVEARGSTAAEAETPLDPPATKTRQRKPATAAAPSTASTSDLEPACTIGGAQIEGDGEHPMLAPKTLAEVKALGNKKVGELGAGPVQQALADNFGVKAFGGLDPADYDRACAVLDVLK